ncbi:ImmA/IrrE family metallo-endopeptidase [Arcanobacterium buesumense]|uniref:ImmA/IrrE family metallo-endopeptidase n=1 Tax=Arcanobacterium buesumense TaxID=2722751 RepID=A0A6H2ELU0_9ACTO|nr:ImmA/IrrE family metallo-endopeptidase [Arcanobacterium buesumense]QJC22037.1 ImmA/IrrE family metallo-endopeptidase [Arcanobacterium buesumense]
MTVEELEQFIESHGVKIVYTPQLETCGGYSKQHQTIYMPGSYQSLPKNALSVLAHEYAHHLLGHDGPQPPTEEERADRLAAQLIISPTEYELAEKLHEGQLSAIAEELGVTTWIVKAYQRCLRVS